MKHLDNLTCNLSTINDSVPGQIWSAVTASEDRLPIWMVRILHNKLRYYSVNYYQCYTHYLSPKTLVDQLGLVPLIIFILTLFILCRYIPIIRLPLAIAILIYPLIMIIP